MYLQPHYGENVYLHFVDESHYVTCVVARETIQDLSAIMHSSSPLVPVPPHPLISFTADCPDATPIRGGSRNAADCHFDLKREGEAKTECRIRSISQRLSLGKKNTGLMFTKCLRQC